MRTKINRILLWLCVFCGCIFVACDVNAATVMVESIDATPDTETVTVYISMKGNKGFSSLGVQVDYNQEVLELTNVVENTKINAMFTGAQKLTKKPYNLCWNSAEKCTFNGTLATLTFKVLKATEGDYPVTINYYEGRNGNYIDGLDVNYDQDLNPLNLVYENGNVKIASGNKMTITINGKETSIVSDEEIEGTILIPIYDQNGRFQGVKKISADGQIAATVDSGSGNYTKILWWEDMATLKPKHSAREVQLY